MAAEVEWPTHLSKKQRLAEFHHQVRLLLTESEQDYLYTVLKEYQSHRQIEKLIQGLCSALDTPVKLDLLKEVRGFIPTQQLAMYDTQAPYSQMAHPIQPSPRGYNTLTLNARGHRQKEIPKAGSSYQPHERRIMLSGIAEPPGVHERIALQTITLVKNAQQGLGFSIRGGSEHGLGIYVSEVEDHSAAQRAGLCLGDNILEVNTVSFEGIASSSAVKVLTGSKKLKMVIRRIGKIPGFKSAREKTSWFDTGLNCVIEGSYEDPGIIHQPVRHGVASHPLGLSYVEGDMERHIHLSITHDNQFLGFNIRGGSEYGLGIYVSRVDPGGVAEQKGLKAGDEITVVNSQSLDKMTHAKAVATLRASKQLILTVKDVGRYPAYKEIYAEYSWIDVDMGTTSRTQVGGYNSLPNSRSQRTGTYRRQLFGSGYIESIPVLDPREECSMSEAAFTEYPMESHVDTYAQTEDNDRYGMAVSYSQDATDASIQTDNEVNSTDMIQPASTQNELFRQADMQQPNTGELCPSDMFHPADQDIVFGQSSMLHTGDQELITQNDMLVPSNQDILFSEKIPLEEDGRKKKEKKRMVPRSTMGVLALEAEHNPETKAHLASIHKSESNPEIRAHLAAIQSLRASGEINIRAAYTEGKDKKSRSFRQLLFGTKPRGDKMKGSSSQGISITKKKSRKPLSAINFSLRKSKENLSKSNRDLNESVFVEGIGSQLMHQGTANQGQALPVITEHAQSLLNEDETTAVIRHITLYEKGGNIDAFVTPLLAILDTPEKAKLLQKIRTVVFSKDLKEYDRMVSEHEKWHFKKNDIKNPLQKEVFYKSQPREKSIAISQPFPNLRRRSQLVDCEELVIPAAPDAQYNYEIHRLKSNSKVYKAKMSEEKDSCTKQTDNTYSSKALQKSCEDSLSLNNKNEHIVRSENASEHNGKPLTSTPVLDSHRTNVKSSECSSTSDYSSGSTSVQSDSVKSQALIIPRDLHATEENEVMPIYETVQYNADKVESNVKLLHHNPTLEENKTLLKKKSSLGRWNTEEAIVSSSGRASTHQSEADRLHSDDNQSVNLAALDFLNYLDREAATSHNVNSDASSSRASSPKLGSYDINDTPNQSIEGPPTESSNGASSEDSLVDSVLGSCGASSEENLAQFEKRHTSPPVFIPPPPPSLPPSLSEDGEQLDEDEVKRREENEVEEQSWREWVEEDVTAELQSLNGRGDNASPQDVSNGNNTWVNENYCNRMSAYESENDHTDNDTMNDISSLVKDISHGNASGSDDSDSEDDSLADIPNDRLWDVAEAEKPDGCVSKNVSWTNSDVIIHHSHGTPVLRSGAIIHHNSDTLRPKSHLPSDCDTRGNDSKWKSFVIQDTDEHDEEGDGIRIVHLIKDKKSLGLSISGGSNSRTQPQIKIDQVFPGGAAAEEGTLQPGMALLMADGYELNGLTHLQVVNIIRRAYANKQEPTMELVVSVPD